MLLAEGQTEAAQFVLKEIERMRDLVNTVHWITVGVREVNDVMKLNLAVPNVFHVPGAIANLAEFRTQVQALLATDMPEDYLRDAP